MPAKQLEYHRVAADRPWWKGVLEALLLIVLFLSMTIAAFVFLMFTGDVDSSVGTVFSIALTLPAAFLAARIVGRNPAQLLSVTGRVRWRIVWRSLLVMVPLTVLTTPLEAFAPTWLMLVYLLVVPVQAATEEFLFRGAPAQIVGSWIRSPWIAYAISVLPFVFLHTYNWIGLIDIFIFAICVSGLVWFTRGLEAAIVMHAVSNIAAFGMQPTEMVTDIAYSDMAISVAVTVVTTGLLIAINYNERFSKKAAQQQS